MAQRWNHRLPPMWPGFKSRRRSHLWVEFVAGSLPCHEGFLRVLRFSPLLKNKHFQIPIWPGIRQTKNHYVDVLPSNRYLFIYLFIYSEDISSFLFSVWVYSNVGKVYHFFLMASISVRFEEYANKSGIPTFLCSLMSCVITVFSVTGWCKIRFKNGIKVISVQSTAFLTSMRCETVNLTL